MANWQTTFPLRNHAAHLPCPLFQVLALLTAVIVTAMVYQQLSSMNGLSCVNVVMDDSAKDNDQRERKDCHA